MPLNIAITSLVVVVPIYKQVALVLWAVKYPPSPKVQPTVAVPAPLLPVEPSCPACTLPDAAATWAPKLAFPEPSKDKAVVLGLPSDEVRRSWNVPAVLPSGP